MKTITSLALAFTISSLSAQLEWRTRTILWDRYAPSLAFDPTSGSMLLFGGQILGGATDGTWKLTTTGWTRLTNIGPSARYAARAATDLSRNRVLLFGGDSGKTDAWSWDGQAWSQFTPISPTTISQFASDDLTGRIIVLQQLPQSWTTWIFDGTRWTQSTALPEPGNIITPAYDATRGTFVAVAPTSRRLWEHDGMSWTDRTPTSMPIATAGSQLMYDPFDKRILLLLPDGSLYAYDGAQFATVSSKTLLHPRVNGDSIVATDWTSRRPVVYAQGTTWTWTGSDWKILDYGSPRHFTGGLTKGLTSFDTVRERLVFWSGEGNDRRVWEWNKERWTYSMPTHSPLPRKNAAMGFDAARGVTILFGGEINGLLLNDHWEWNGAQWEQKFPGTTPLPRRNQAMAFDPRRGTLLMFGQNEWDVDELWEWNGSTWTRRQYGTSPGMDHISHPLFMFFDLARREVVAHDKKTQTMWEWNGSTWSMINASSRIGSGLTYDHARQRAVSHCNDDIIEWTGSTWLTRRFPLPKLTTCDTELLAFDGDKIIYKPLGINRTIKPELMVQYELSPIDPAIATTFGSSCQGSSSRPALAAENRPWTGSPFRLELSRAQQTRPTALIVGYCATNCGPITYPIDLTPIGMTGCSLYTEPWMYLSGITDSSGKHYWNISICDCLNLLGINVFVQAVVDDSLANPLGLVTTNAVQARIGAR